jgi:tetratricopeptide (TPR) repeat protein
MPDKALDAYTRALAIDPNYHPSILGRGLALAGLGRYDEALQYESPDFRVQAFLLSRVGRYREAADVLDKGRREDDDAEVTANAALTSAWMAIELKQYARALEEVGAAEKSLADRPQHSSLVLAGLIGGVAEIRSGNVKGAASRLAYQKTHRSGDDRVEDNWIAALEGETALAERQYDRAISSFDAAKKQAWLVLNRDASTVFASNLPSRDGIARVALARGNRATAIDEYRRLTTPGPANRSSAVLEPRHILALARLLAESGDKAGARVEYQQFLKLWEKADADLPELSEARQALSVSNAK